MATYVYRCPDCACFDVVQPMSAVRPTHDCPACGRQARRVFTAPALATIGRGVHRAADAAAASAETPQVVTSLPAGAPRPRTPRWNPLTGPRPVNASTRPAGPYPSLPRS